MEIYIGSLARFNMRTTMSLIKIALAIASLGFASASPTKHNDGKLVYGPPESVGMLSAPLHQMVQNISAYTHAANYSRFSHYQIRPIEPGSVTLVARNSVIVSEVAVGKRNLYADVNGTELPRHLQEATTVDTVYDMASLTKLFTTVAALRELDAGRIALNTTVATYIPEFATNGKENITILELFTHTSGFDADPSPSLFSASYTTYEERINAILTQKIINAPGSTYLYSDLNFMSLALVIQTVTGRALDALVYDFTKPLGMTSTFFNRGNIEGFTPQTPNYYRTATQEFQIAVLGPEEPQRPQPVRGTVHDENAWSLDGVSGHAGLFSTARDTAAFCQMILNNGTYGGQRILSQTAVDLIFTNFNARFPGNAHGLGFELDQYYTAGPMASLQTASHTGFTGTTLQSGASV
uniref:Beta-lactamase-related domain-containing protein n=2 Tax=Talaromyces marneffei PM1 TaxID=1077442 RepID=A0A093V918_TALMA